MKFRKRSNIVDAVRMTRVPTEDDPSRGESEDHWLVTESDGNLVIYDDETFMTTYEPMDAAVNLLTERTDAPPFTVRIVYVCKACHTTNSQWIPPSWMGTRASRDSVPADASTEYLEDGVHQIQCGHPGCQKKLLRREGFFYAHARITCSCGTLCDFSRYLHQCPSCRKVY